jgi:hypothetical protein
MRAPSKRAYRVVAKTICTDDLQWCVPLNCNSAKDPSRCAPQNCELRYSLIRITVSEAAKLRKSVVCCLSLVAPLLGLWSCGSISGRSMDEHDPSYGKGARKSIGAWVSCTGTSDDTAGVAKAIAAAGHGAFTLVVDCPVQIKVGMDISRSIFIDDGTTIEFTGAGKFTVDNVQIPAFVIADSSHITLTNWNVEYDASMSVSPQVAGYVNNGQFIKGRIPAAAFNDIRLMQWLAANRAIVFDGREGHVTPPWTGPTNACAVFFISGDSSVVVTGMRMYVPPAAGGERFIPVAFSLGVNFKSNQTVIHNTPVTAQNMAVPHDLKFSNINLDGTYMGWVGGLRDALFENIRSQRYGDLQDAQGGNVGGVGKWFAPPHLFYFGYSTTGDPGLFSTNIQIRNVVDNGPRVGTARDRGAGDSLSGYALSLKIGCVNCIVDNYKSTRPDGFLDVLPSDGLTISNVTATYDSSFLNNVFPGWRFPSSSYKNVRFENITLIDLAASSVLPPISNVQGSNQGIVFKNVHVEINHWEGQGGAPIPTVAGQGQDVSLDYVIKADGSRVTASQAGTVAVTFRATPATLRVGDTTTLTWTARQATGCSGGGAWSGGLGTSGTRTLTMTSPGDHEFKLACQNAGDTANAALHIEVK